jgi:hypothetical protein
VLTRPAESGADIAKNVAPTQWWAAIPPPLNRHGPIEAARRSLGALPQYDRPAGAASASANRTHAIRQEKQLAAPACASHGRLGASLEAPAALFGLKLTSRDERHSVAKFAPLAPPKATPAGTNYQSCKLSSSLGQISLAMGRSRD